MISVANFLKKYNFDRSFLIGYYGGTNFGDELLLEVLLYNAKLRNAQGLSFLYLNNSNYSTYHDEYGYNKCLLSDKFNLLKNLLLSKSVIVGGGGHWGQDFNMKIAVLSVILLFCKIFLRKDVILLGVGVYSTLPKWGEKYLWCALKASKYIYVRDKESYEICSRVKSDTILDKDIALAFSEVQTFPKRNFKIHGDIKCGSTIITLRHFSAHKKNAYNEALFQVIKSNPDLNFIILCLSAHDFEGENNLLISRLKQDFHNVTDVIPFNCNPLDIIEFLRELAPKEIKIVSPQYHMQIVSYLNKVPFAALAYDSKNIALFDNLNISSFIDIRSTSLNTQINFINNFINRHG
jgi:polysaccharide pyruvyl transferase WcaK-like protein